MKLYISALQLENGELLLVVSPQFNANAIQDYALRWEIETLFSCLKGRGFNLENTRLTDARRVKKLIAVLAISFCWCYLTGEWQHDQKKAIKIKKHGRLSVSLFRYGLDYVQMAILRLIGFGKKEEFKKVKVGLPWEDDTQMGVQVNGNQVKVISKYVDIAKEEGCQIIVGGGKSTDPALARGEFFQPTLILAPDNKKRVAQEEIFGPVAVVIKFKDEADVIKMANDSDYGLGGAVWTYNINRALRVARALETGRVWVNCYNRLPAGAPFGGYKTSGIGRETHKMMLDAYTQVKNIFISTREEREGMY